MADEKPLDLQRKILALEAALREAWRELDRLRPPRDPVPVGMCEWEGVRWPARQTLYGPLCLSSDRPKET